MSKETKFYMFDQNNTGGSFDTDDKLCHRLVIEAWSNDDANRIAETLGAYWDGVDMGYDCPCCGDRWYSGHEIDIDHLNELGYEVDVFPSEGKDRNMTTEEYWNWKYGEYSRKTEPKFYRQFGTKRYGTKITFKSVEEYCQFMADSYGWTVPDIRIFYLNGEVKEFFTKEGESNE